MEMQGFGQRIFSTVVAVAAAAAISAPVVSAVAIASDCQHPDAAASFLKNADAFQADGLKKFFDKLPKDASGTDAALCCLPERFRQNYVIVFDTKSFQPSSFGSPRVLLYDPAGSGNLADRKAPIERSISFNGQNRTLEEIRFNRPSTLPAGTPIDSTFAEYIAGGGNLPAGHAGGKAGTTCISCHAKSSGGGIFDSSPIWNGVFGGGLRHPDLEQIKREQLHLRLFQQTLQHPGKGRPYRCLVGLDKKLACLEKQLERQRATLEASNVRRGPTGGAVDSHCDREYLDLTLADREPIPECALPDGTQTLGQANFDFTERLALEGANRMANCIERNAKDHLKPLLLGITACGLHSIQDFLPTDCKGASRAHRMECETLFLAKAQLPIPNGSDLRRILNRPEKECSLGRELNDSALSYSLFYGALRAGGGAICVDKLLLARDKQSPDPFVSLSLANVTRLQADNYKSSGPVAQARELVNEDFLKSGGRPDGEKLRMENCAKLAELSRAELGKAFGISRETDAEKAKRADAIKTELAKQGLRQLSRAAKLNAALRPFTGEVPVSVKVKLPEKKETQGKGD